MILYENAKTMDDSPGGDTDFFDMSLEYYKEIHYLFILCLDYVRRTSIDLMKKMVFLF